MNNIIMIIMLPRVKKSTKYLFYYMPTTPNKTWEDKNEANKTQQISATTKVFFVKTKVQHI